MFSLLLAGASLTPAFNDASYADLASVNPGPAGECIASFGGGSIEIRQAFNEAERTMINVAVITGKPARAIPAGTRLWVKSSYGPAWRALVTASSPGRITVVARSSFVGDLIVDAPSIALHDRLEAGSVADSVFVDIGDQGAGFRQKLATALDCSDALGL